MIFRLSHKTHYTYSSPVFLEPHVIRLNPRNDAYQKISNFSLKVVPRPAGIQHFSDAEGNLATCIWFKEKTATLSITTSFEAQTLCKNPFAYLVTDDSFIHLPARYENFDTTVLEPFRAAIDTDDRVKEFARSVFEDANGETLLFLSRLCSSIYKDFKVETRKHGSPVLPSVTIQNRRGACRDMALLYMAACRNYGLATRFVSGYQEGDSDMTHRHLHAWVEVYIPGGGWRGYDPSHGLAVADRHIALSASYAPAGTLPVKGNFRGTGVTAEMKYFISLN